MLDFFEISTQNSKKGTLEIYPEFIIKKSSDLMIRGGDFYAIWIEDKKLWSTDEQDVIELVDRELSKAAESYRASYDGHVKVLYMRHAKSGVIDSWHKYCQKQMRDSFHTLDEKLIFSNTDTTKKDYASKKLPYALEDCDTPAYDRLMGVLYSPEERHKIEWAIGAIVSGDSKKIQKFLVLYGAPKTGKSTVLDIILKLFDGYTSVFDAKALGSSSNAFALEAFRTNPLVAVQQDGDLSHIEDNTRLNSLVSHEMMMVNEKFKAAYSNRFKTFLFMGTNKPVKITDAKSGLLRRLIDVSPTGDRVPKAEYDRLKEQINFELGGIAKHCLDIYTANPKAYDDYTPMAMLGASNDFYNFVADSYYVFKKEDKTSLKTAWDMYNQYCEEAKVYFPFSQRIFKEELKNYFRDYVDRITLDDGSRVRSYYIGFRAEKFDATAPIEESEKTETKPWLIFKAGKSVFDDMASDYPAQYSTDGGTPMKSWAKVSTKLSEIDTSKLHYVQVPINHIVIDFDIPDEHGNKSFEKNLAEALKWPTTYAELSKSGAGIHLHYIYTGNPEKLLRTYADHIEVKVFTGNSALRRMLTKCNDLPIATISSGLPTKGERMVSQTTIRDSKDLRRRIEKCLNREYENIQHTAPNISFIKELLDQAYASGMSYDVTSMRNAVLTFAANSTNQPLQCIRMVNQMHFKSDETEENIPTRGDNIIFLDVEVFPNMNLVSWKRAGEDEAVHHMFNPSPSEVEELFDYDIVTFNGLRYDNHILWAIHLGYSPKEVYNLSQGIISGKKVFFNEAYNVSYTDIYDFSSKKQSLKKFEIELGIHHQELGLPWDKPVDKELWPKVAEYCENDVIATEAVFNARKGDFTARKILAELSGMTPNDTTNTLTTRLIFGKNRNPQSEFHYRNLGCPYDCDYCKDDFKLCGDGHYHLDPEYTAFDDLGQPYFPGYEYKAGISTYRTEEVGEGGYVWSEPGIYGNVALLDITSMHPSSIIAEELFGPVYTSRFKEILDARVAIKNKDFDTAREMMDGKLAKYLDDPSIAKDLAQALKIAINSVYGLTAASFPNPFRDNRNKDNIVAKRGALFMINLKHEVQNRGFHVAHIKTDSIKIPDATPEIIEFVMEYGKLYGYSFMHEATYDRMALVNDAVYVAKYATEEKCQELYGYVPGDNRDHPGEWTATGTQFAVPYVFKTLFTHEDIEFKDLCETKSVTSGSIYLDMNEYLPSVASYEDEFKKLLKRNATQKELDILYEAMAEGHDYHFVGRVGLFCPIKPGKGGGELVRESVFKGTDYKKYDSVTGTKGYRWLEAEMVKNLGREDDIDVSYYHRLVDVAAEAIKTCGENTMVTYDWFVSDDPYIPPKYINGQPDYIWDLPF